MSDIRQRHERQLIGSLAILVPNLLLRFYRVTLSPVLGQNCRFEPSCSRYLEQALEKHGLVRGAWRGLLRVLRCHPWSPGGYDPVG